MNTSKVPSFGAVDSHSQDTMGEEDGNSELILTTCLASIHMDRVATIDEDIVLPIRPSTPLQKSMDLKSASLQRWKQAKPLIFENSLQSISEEDSHTTLASSNFSMNKQSKPGISARLTKLLEQQKERKQSKAKGSGPSEAKFPNSSKKNSLSAEVIHSKSSSLLQRISDIGKKLQQFKPFSGQEAVTAKKEDSQKEEDMEIDSDSDSGEGDMFDSLDEYQYVLKSKHQFENRYELIREIGAGGHSTVQLAKRLSDDREVACKFIKKASVWRWYKEGSIKIPYEVHVQRSLSELTLTEPDLKVVYFHEYYRIGAGRFVVIMEYLGNEWCDLYDYVEYHGPVKERHSREIFTQVFKTLRAMHRCGYYHNDIKGNLKCLIS
jgi:hypothetical protein